MYFNRISTFTLIFGPLNPTNHPTYHQCRMFQIEFPNSEDCDRDSSDEKEKVEEVEENFEAAHATAAAALKLK